MASNANQLVIELIVRDQAGNVIKSLDTNLKNLDATAKQAKQDLNQMGQGAAEGADKAAASVGLFSTKLEGISRRDVARAMTGAFLGVDAALSALGSKADADTQKFLAMAKSVESVGIAFAFGGVVGGGLAAAGLALGLIIDKLQEAQKAVEQVRVPFTDLQKTLSGLGPAVDPLAASLEKVLGVSSQLAAEMANAARANDTYRASLSALATAAEAEAVAETKRAQAIERAATIQRVGVYQVDAIRAAMQAAHDLDVSMLEAGRGARVMQGELTGVADKAREVAVSAFEAARGLNALSIAAMTGAGNISTLTERLSDAAVQMRELRASTIDTAEDSSSLAASLANVKFQEDQDAEATRRATEAMNKQKAAAEALKNALMGMVEKALAPTAVTEADIAATRAGKYVDKWDEFARRAEAVAKGTDPSKFGTKFEEQLKGLGLTAEQAAAGFRDFSLFADPKNLKLVDWGPVVADVQHQIDMLIGKANLAKAAFDQVWASLSPTKKASLADALGLDASQAGNAEKVFKAMSGDTSEKSAKLTGEIAANIQKIEGIHTAIVNVVKAATFDANLKQILDDLAKIPNDYTVTVSINYTAAAAPEAGSSRAAGTGATGRAAGGPVAAGQAYLVGEAGPELFTPNASGQIVSNKLMQQIMDAGKRLFTPGLRDSLKNIGDVDQWLGANYGSVASLYQMDPSLWMGIAGQHHWSHWDWFQFLENLFSPLGKAAGRSSTPGPSTSPAAASPGDFFRGATINVYPRDLGDFMQQTRAMAAHRA